MHYRYNFTGQQLETLKEMDPFIMMDLKKAIVDFKDTFGGVVKMPTVIYKPAA